MTDSTLPADLPQFELATGEATDPEVPRSDSGESLRSAGWRSWVGAVLATHEAGVPF